MKLKNLVRLLSVTKSNFVKNSFWGLISTTLQTLFLSLFFVIVSRQYSTLDFANYLIATTIYQFMVGISSMGLGTWFVREYGNDENNRNGLISRFIKIQVLLGIFFYLVNICLIFILYQNEEIILLGVVLGTNIIFDNIIYAVTSLNIAQFKQKKTAIIMALDAFVRLTVVCLLFIWPFSILVLSVFLVLIRLFTVNIFFRVGIAANIGIKYLWNYKLSLTDIKKQILPNWRFVIIAGLSIILWRSSTIIISKFLAVSDVANYEVAFKILSIFIIVPLITSTTVYPQFVKYVSSNDYNAIRKFYNIIFFTFSLFSLISYAFILSFADLIIPLIFGSNYTILTADSLKEIFLTFLIFPTALLQANLIVAMKLEKLDMYFNFIALAIFFTSCFVGLHFYKSLSVINYSIFISFSFFHLIQSIFLIKSKITSSKIPVLYYFTLIAFVFSYKLITEIFNPMIPFVVVLIIGTSIFVIFLSKKYREYYVLSENV